ncbi:Mitochondrial import inner membrane translocase subunit tim23 [Cladochytrium tenue]|nr:Mitochondrial import inner membrane translocase subunit tim23 [Cladochytrium tenue]
MSFLFGRGSRTGGDTSAAGTQSEFVSDADVEARAGVSSTAPSHAASSSSAAHDHHHDHIDHHADGSRQGETFQSMISPVFPQAPSTESLLSQLHPLPDDDKGIQYLFINDNPLAPAVPGVKKQIPKGRFGPIPMRSNYDKLLYGTGIAYVSGLVAGGTYGAVRGYRIAQGTSYKIRSNSLLNGATRYGPWAANSLGVLTMGWALIDNLIYSYRQKSDAFGHITSAFLSGVIFKSTGLFRSLPSPAQLFYSKWWMI